jgi:hypothetical protein
MVHLIRAKPIIKCMCWPLLPHQILAPISVCIEWAMSLLPDILICLCFKLMYRGLQVFVEWIAHHWWVFRKNNTYDLQHSAQMDQAIWLTSLKQWMPNPRPMIRHPPFTSVSVASVSTKREWTLIFPSLMMCLWDVGWMLPCSTGTDEKTPSFVNWTMPT